LKIREIAGLCELLFAMMWFYDSFSAKIFVKILT